jgi:hypothetical protein
MTDRVPTRRLTVCIAALLLAVAGPAAASAADPPEGAVNPESPAAAADPLAACLPQRGQRKRDLDEFCLLRVERIGSLHIGLGEKEALSAIPCPVSKGKEVYLDATGDYAQKWSFPACGIELDMVATSKGSPKSIAAIVIAPPSSLVTSRGIGVGTPEEKVLEAYQPFLDKGATRRGKTIVAGSIYGGLIVSLAQGQVSEIFLGAIAD